MWRPVVILAAVLAVLSRLQHDMPGPQRMQNGPSAEQCREKEAASSMARLCIIPHEDAEKFAQEQALPSSRNLLVMSAFRINGKFVVLELVSAVCSDCQQYVLLTLGTLQLSKNPEHAMESGPSDVVLVRRTVGRGGEGVRQMFSWDVDC